MTDTLGRQAIEVLKAALRDGVTFHSVPEIRAFVLKKLKLKATTVSEARAWYWGRQAQLENADAGYANTAPLASVGYLRSAGADPDTRSASLRPEVKYNAKRVDNLCRVATTNAAQPDATRAEIERAAMLSVVAPMLRQVARL